MPKSVWVSFPVGRGAIFFYLAQPEKVCGTGWLGGGSRGIDRLVVGVGCLSFLAVSTNSKLINSVLAYLLRATLLFLTACVC